jgi:hypothetical protein
MATPITKWLRRVAALAMATMYLSAVAGAQQLEYDVKGQFLGHFTGFIHWPEAAFASASAPFRICILGRDPFGTSLDARMRGEQVNGRRIAIDRIRTEADAATCQIVFYGDNDVARAEALSKATRGRPVLIVTDSTRLLEHCAAIAFVLEGGRVRFDLNLAALSGHGLQVNPRLLSVARDASDRFTHCN